MGERDWLTERFQAHRPHLRAVAYRMLGSLTEADDAVQGTWLRLSRSRTDTSEVHRRYLLPSRSDITVSNQTQPR